MDKLKLKLERGRLVLELPESAMDVEVNGALQAQYFLGPVEGPEDFRERLRKANAAHAACSIMRAFMKCSEATGHAEAKKQAAAVAGFLAGLRGEYRRMYPKDSGVGGAIQAPECGKHPWREFSDGWSAGSAVWAAVTMAETGEDPRAEW